MRLAGKTAVVTGGASGFGAGMIRRFAAEGANAVIADIDDELGSDLARELADAGLSCVHVHCDVTRGDDVGNLIETAANAFGAVDVMINNAGMPQTNQPMLDVAETTFDAIFEVNVKSIFLTTKAVVPVMRAQGGGSIINTASTAALRPRPGLAWYNASKGAVTTLTKAMAVELAPEQIRVNALCPVAGETPMLDAFMGGTVTDEMRAAFIASVPLGRLSTPRDVANAALFLASDESDFITGVCLEVDGGRCV